MKNLFFSIISFQFRCNLILRRKVSVRKKALFCSARKRPVNSRKAPSKGTQLGEEQRNNTIKCFAIERKEGKKKMIVE